MKKILCYLVFSFCFYTSLHSQVIFTGQGDMHTWEDGENWRKDGISGLPKSGDDILIDGFSVDLTNSTSLKYGTLELRNNAYLSTQTYLYLSGDFIIDPTSTFEVTVQDVDIFDRVYCDGNYFINGNVSIRFSGHVPRIGDSYQFIVGNQGSCGANTSFLVSNNGFEVTVGVECNSDGVNYMITGLNYTTAIAWDGEGGDGMWNNPANWDPNGIPPINSYLIFNQPEGSYTKTVGAGITDVQEVFIGRNNTLEINGDFLLGTYIYLANGGKFKWNSGKLYKKDPDQQSLLISYGYVSLDGPGTKILDTDVEIWSFSEDINHNQGNFNINNGKVKVFNSHNYNINDDNITIGYTSGSTHELRFDYGSVIKKNGNGVSTIDLTTFYNMGNIISEIGTLDIKGSLTTAETGNYAGKGKIKFPPGFILDGNISPGSSPGLLTVVGDFQSSEKATFNFEINGPTAGVQYDQLLVTNTAILDGTINPILGYLPANNASFEVLKATTLASCNFPSQITAYYNNTPYIFNVTCLNNILYLNGPGFSLSTKEDEIQNLVFYPNPVKDFLNIKSPSNLEGKYELFNSIGQKVKQGLLNKNETKIAVEDLSSGIYLLQIHDSINQTSTSEKIVIE